MTYDQAANYSLADFALTIWPVWLFVGGFILSLIAKWITPK